MKKLVLSVFVLGAIFFVSVFVLLFFWRLQIDSDVVLQEWEDISVFKKELNTYEEFLVKLYLNLSEENLESIYAGVYNFEGSYRVSDFVEKINKGPDKSYKSITIREGWSIYDVDKHLNNLDLIDSGEYENFAKSDDIISSYKERYDFLSVAGEDNEINTLEGFLYPETYHIDIQFLEDSQKIIDQLIYMQLEQFDQTVWESLEGDYYNFNENLSARWYVFDLDFYDIVKLASIIEKEENYDQNKPLIAWIFINRLNENMRLDADVSLCYWLDQAYQNCDQDTIREKVDDATNPYNTRVKHGMTPTPISNINFHSINAVLNFEETTDFYYLHDQNWNIHTSSDLESHRQKRINYWIW